MAENRATVSPPTPTGAGVFEISRDDVALLAVMMIQDDTWTSVKLKKCVTCGRTKPLDHFVKGNSRNGDRCYRSRCKPCRNAERRIGGEGWLP